MRRVRTSLAVTTAILVISAGCGWCFGRAFLRQFVLSCAVLGR